ncbi:MAG: hypothetical protein ACXV3S_05140 [Kineosporiaceae bacterium]
MSPRVRRRGHRGDQRLGSRAKGHDPSAAGEGGYTFAPASYLRRTPPTGLVARPFDPPLELPLVLIWRGVPGRALEQLLRLLPR